MPSHLVVVVVVGARSFKSRLQRHRRGGCAA
jgi:hypothetical protein